MPDLDSASRDAALAGEHMLGLLEGDELRAVEQRMTNDSDFRRAVESWSDRLIPLAGEAPDATPPTSVWEAIQARLPSAPSSRRRDEGVWMDVGPGARMKLLSVNPLTHERSALLRLEAGSVFPRHSHDQPEECLVLEGSLEIEGETYHAGDYILAAADTHHPEIPSSAGALVLLHWNALAA